MKGKTTIAAFFAATSMAVVATNGFAADSFNLSYGGRLAEQDGRPVGGPVDVKVSFFRSEGASEPIAVAPQIYRGVELKDGVFQLSLSFTAEDYQTVFPSTEPVWIALEDLTTNETYARQRLGMVPFAGKVPVDGQTIVFNDKGALSVGPAGAPAAGQFLTKDTSGALVWRTPVAASIGGSAVGSAAPAAGQVLKFNGTEWVPSAETGGAQTAAASGKIPVAGGSGTIDRAWLPAMTGDSGAGGSLGAVPAPAPGDAAAGKVLRADGTWASMPWHVPGAIGATTPNSAVFTTVATTGAMGINTPTPGSQLEIKGAGTTSATSSLSIADASGATRLFVRDDGKIGIGTTAPSGLLHLSSAAGPLLNIETTSGTSALGGIVFKNPTNADTQFSWIFAPQAPGTGDQRKFVVADANTTHLAFNRPTGLSSTRFDIGSWSSATTGKLNVINDLGTTYPTATFRGFAAQTADLMRVQTGDGVSQVVIDSGGKVGIGTPNPGSQLTIGYGTPTTPEYAGFVSIIDSASKPLTIAPKDPSAFWTANSGIHTLLRLSSNSWFGMAQETGASIDFAQDWATAAQARIAFFNEIAGTGSGGLQFQTHSDSAWNYNLSLGPEGSVWVGAQRFGAARYVDPSATRLLVQGSSSDAGALAMKVMNAAATPLLSVRNDGNVGIGTLSPEASLDVNGAMRLAKNSSAPFACASAKDGAIALTSLYTLCVCKGGTSAWVKTADGATACSW